jgi:hypothetical protein
MSGLAALFVALVAGGCTAGGGGDGSSGDSKGDDPSVSLPQPGKYQTLQEPCGSVPVSMLKDLLPGAASLPAEQQEQVFRGTPAVTYDTDRRVGCSWKADSPSASHRLSVDIERVVSYDPSQSDADLAKDLYMKKEKGADVPSSSSSPSAPPSGGGADGGADGGAVSDGDPSGSPSGSPSGAGGDAGGPPALSPGLQPRELSGLGDAAYVDDVLSQSGSATRTRTVSVVFRTSNVIVTVTYAQQPTHPDEVPDSKELQDRAQAVAKELADEFNDE